MDININGGCLCGSVRYSANAEPLVTQACWCKLCQTLASGNATINLAFPANAITINGKLNDYSSVADDGNRMHRKFCPNCGVHVISEAEERPNIIVIRAGTLDDIEQVKIEGVIWTSTAPSWAYLDPDIPHFIISLLHHNPANKWQHWKNYSLRSNFSSEQGVIRHKH